MSNARAKSTPMLGLTMPAHGLPLVCAIYLIFSLIFASASLDVDEWGFAQEPYELLGGDYTRGYLEENELAHAAGTILKSYYFYWTYRPLFAPIVAESDRDLFSAEEVRFGYIRPPEGRLAADFAQSRLVVPEPDRFYQHGAGKPLLPAVLSTPQVWLTALITSGGPSLPEIQVSHDYHPIFILTRLVQILSGLLTTILVWGILAREYDTKHALLGAACVAMFPLTIVWFPNLHHDSILTPFVLLTAYSFHRQRYMWAGVFFGLALASKNVAVFLAPSLLAYVLWNAYEPGDSDLMGTRHPRLIAGLRGWTLAMLLGGLTLLPFAQPISYVREVATPIIHRKYDTRGEDVSRFTLTGKLRTRERQGNKAHRSDLRPEVRAINSAVGFQEMWFLFATLGLLALFSRSNRPLARMCLLVLLLSVALSPVFGHDLNYRMLMFVPFFAILAVDIARPKPLLGLLAVLLVIDLVYVIDPMTTTTIHLPVERRGLAQP